MVKERIQLDEAKSKDLQFTFEEQSDCSWILTMSRTYSCMVATKLVLLLHRLDMVKKWMSMIKFSRCADVIQRQKDGSNDVVHFVTLCPGVPFLLPLFVMHLKVWEEHHLNGSYVFMMCSITAEEMSDVMENEKPILMRENGDFVLEDSQRLIIKYGQIVLSPSITNDNVEMRTKINYISNLDLPSYVTHFCDMLMTKIDWAVMKIAYFLGQDCKLYESLFAQDINEVYAKQIVSSSKRVAYALGCPTEDLMFAVVGETEVLHSPQKPASFIQCVSNYRKNNATKGSYKDLFDNSNNYL